VITTSIVIALAMALFGLLVNSSAAGTLVAYASSGGLCGFGGKCEFAVQEECPPPNKSDWCSSNEPLKEEVPGLGGR